MKSVSILFLTVASIALSDVSLTSISDLEKFQGYSHLTLNGGYLWATRQNSLTTPQHRIEVFSQDGSHLVAAADLPFMADSLQAFGSNEVIVVGRHNVEREKAINHQKEIEEAEAFEATATPEEIEAAALAAYAEEDKYGPHSYYATAQLKDGAIALKTIGFPKETLAEFFGGTPNRMYFNDIALGLFSFEKGTQIFLKSKIMAPGRMVQVGNSLYVLSRGALNQLFDKNLVHVNLKTEKATKIFAKDTTVLGGLQSLDGGRLVAVTEATEKLTRVVDTKTNAQVAALRSEGYPFAVAQYGSCLVTLTAKPRHLNFYSLKTLELIDVWNFDKLITVDFESPQALAVDEKAQRIFVQSAFYGNHSIAGIVGLQNLGVQSPCL